MWKGVMKQFYLHPGHIMKDGMFRKQFEKLLEANSPEAHYLEGLRYAVWKTDLVSAKKHVFKAIYIVPEASFLMAMFAICGGNNELEELFTDHLKTLPWGEVLEMRDSVLSSLTRMSRGSGFAYAQTWSGCIPDCAEFHNIHSRCEECSSTSVPRNSVDVANLNPTSYFLFP